MTRPVNIFGSALFILAMKKTDNQWQVNEKSGDKD
jgi:hypothetical protein